MKLTEKEFETIIEALDLLPIKSQDGKLAAKLMVKMLLKGDEEAMQKAEDELLLQEMKEEAELKETKKRIGIITGKLYMMKDELVEQPS